MSTPPLGLSTGSLHTLPLDVCFRLAAEHGFDGVEIICDERPEARDPDHLRGLAEAHGLPILALHAPFPTWAIHDWKTTAAGSIVRTVRLAEAVGAEHVVVHVPRPVVFRKVRLGPVAFRVPRRSAYGVALRRWMAGGGLAALQQGTRVLICVENLPRLKRWLGVQFRAAWNTLEAWPTVHQHLTLDTTHWAASGVEPLDAYRAGRARIRHVHLSNFRGGRQHLLPYAGDLDLAGLLRRVAADGFDGQIVVEVQPAALEANDSGRLHDHLARSLAFCRAALRAGTRDEAV